MCELNVSTLFRTGQRKKVGLRKARRRPQFSKR
ncbi:30S ribosomal protein S9 [Yersinia similis]